MKDDNSVKFSTLYKLNLNAIQEAFRREGARFK